MYGEQEKVRVPFCTLGTYYLGRDIHFIAAFFHQHRSLLLVLSAIVFVALLVYLVRSGERAVNSRR